MTNKTYLVFVFMLALLSLLLNVLTGCAFESQQEIMARERARREAEVLWQKKTFRLVDTRTGKPVDEDALFDCVYKTRVVEHCLEPLEFQ